MSASIVAFPARDSRTRFECSRHAAEARREQAAELGFDSYRGELAAIGEKVADEIGALSRSRRILRLAELERRRRVAEVDRKLVESVRRSGVFPEPTGPEVA